MVMAILSPGPDFILVSQNALSYDKRTAIYTAWGVSLGAFVLSISSIFGLTLIIQKSTLLFKIIEFGGALYLIYLGVSSLLNTKKTNMQFDGGGQQRNLSYSQAFSQGLLCSVLNPKSMLFFLALFTILIKPDSSYSLKLAYGLEVSVLYLSWFIFLSIMITHSNVKNTIKRIIPYIKISFGILLVTLGIYIIKTVY